MKKVLTACALTLALAACGGTSSTGGVVSAPKQTGFLGSEKATTDVETAKAFASTQDVVIGGFLVGYDIVSSDSVKAGGGLMGSGFGGKSSARVTLSGIDNATLQSITDAAYKDFVADLKAKGYNVVDRSTLLASDDFKKTKTYPNPFVVSGGGIVSGKAETRYFAPSSFGQVRLFLGDVQGETGGFGFANPSMGAANFAANEGNPRVLNVRYTVDFSNTDKYGGWHSNSSSMKVGQGLSVAAGSKLGLIGGQAGTFSSANGTITLGQPVDSPKEFGQITDTTSGAHKATEVATNVIGVLGGIGSNSSRHYEVKAEPAKYKAAAIDALDKANDSLTSKMHSLK